MSDILPPSPDPARDEARVRAGFWRKLRANLPRLPFAGDLLAAWYAARDPSTPRRVRWGLYAALAYFVLPADAVPDFIAALGYTDDAAVLIATLKSLGGAIRPPHRDAAEQALKRLGGDEAV